MDPFQRSTSEQSDKRCMLLQRLQPRNNQQKQQYICLTARVHKYTYIWIKDHTIHMLYFFLHLQSTCYIWKCNHNRSTINQTISLSRLLILMLGCC